jgi:predicted membrane protein
MHCHHHHHHRARPLRRVVFGFFIILIGVLALLDNLKLFDARALLQFWPIVLVVAGVGKIIRARYPAGYLFGAILISIGTVLGLQNAGLIHFELRLWWPVLLIAGGMVVIVKGLFRRDAPRRNGMEGNTMVEHGSYVNARAVLSGIILKSDSQEFQGGEVSAVMGGVELDLRQASMQEQARLELFTFWGGISIKVPQDWSVVMNGVPVLGGIEDRSVPPMNPAKRLLISGYAIMGGIEIKN